MSFIQKYTGIQKVGRAGGKSHAAGFIVYKEIIEKGLPKIITVPKIYDLTAMVNLLSNPPSEFSDIDRALVNKALEDVAMQNFGMVRTP